MSLPEYGPHLPASPSQWRQQRNSLVPSGFECVAHPVFFRISELSTQSSAAPTAASATAERRRLDATSTPTTTISQTAAAAWDVEALGKGGSLGASDLRGAAGGIRGGAQGGEREVDAVCPICLGKFERPVTLTSCLHSFCHTCILGWYEHTVAVALSQGDLSAFRPERGAPINSTRNGTGNSSSNSGGGNSNSPRPVPYRCPLCQVPGPFFLSVEPVKADNNSSKKNADNGKNKPSKLKFRLLGARTVFGGGGPTSGGMTVDEHAGGVKKAEDVDGTGYPSPTMSQLRAAVRIQLALASAAQESGAGAGAGTGGVAKQKSQPTAVGRKREGIASGEGGESGDSSSATASPRPVGDDRDGDTVRPAGGGSTSRSGSRDGRAAGGGGDGGLGDERGKGESSMPPARPRRERDLDFDHRDGGEGTDDDGFGFRRRTSSAGGQGVRQDSARTGTRAEGGSRSNLDNECYGDASGDRSRRERTDDGRRRERRKKRKRSRDRASGIRSVGDFSSGGGSSGGTTAGGSGGRLPWEPGALEAEDGLALIEAMLEKEKDSLRRKSTGGGDPRS